MKNEDIGKLALSILMIMIILMVGARVLFVEQEAFYTFCKNKTGIINMTGDFSSIDCDYYVNKSKHEERVKYEN